MADSQSADWNGGYPGARVRRTIEVTNSVVICDQIIAALIDAGWEDRGPVAARATMHFAFGAPYTSVPVGPGPFEPYTQYTHVIQGDLVTFYDPYRDPPDFLLPNRIWVPMGLDNESSLLALEGVINGGSDWHVQSMYNAGADGWVVILEANTTGTSWNSTEVGGFGQVYGVGFWGAGAFSSTYPNNGGGHVLRASNDTGWLECKVYVDDQATLEFTSSEGGVVPRVGLTPEGLGGFGATDLELIANQFQFWMWTPNSYAGFGSSMNTVMASLPYIEPGHGVDYAAVVTRSFRNGDQWEAGSDWSAVNGGFEFIGSTFHGRVIGCYQHWYGATLTDAVGMAIALPAFVGAPVTGSPRSRAGFARIVGKLWDTYIAHRQDTGFTRDERVSGAGDLRYECVGINTTPGWPPGSVWVAYGSTTDIEE